MTEKYNQLENLFSWAEFYNNSKNLAVTTIPNKKLFDKTQKQILILKKELAI